MDASVGHHELADPRVPAAEGALRLDIATRLPGDRETGAAATSGVAGNVFAAVVRCEVACRLAQGAGPDMFLANQDRVAGAVGERAQAGPASPLRNEPVSNLGVADNDRPVRRLIVEVSLVALAVAA